MPLTYALLRMQTRAAARRFADAVRNPGEAQRRLLLEILRADRRRLDAVRTIRDFQTQVPISESDGDRGSEDIGDVAWRREAACVWTHAALGAHPRIAAGDALLIPPPGSCDPRRANAATCELPALLRRRSRFLTHAAGVSDCEARGYVTMRAAIERDIRLLAGAQPSLLLRLIEKADVFSEHVIRDVRDGALSDRFFIEPEIRSALERRFRRQPRRAKLLEDARRRNSGTLRPADYWPNLELIACCAGGAAAHAVERLRSWVARDGGTAPAFRDLGCRLANRRASIPLDDETAAGPLAVLSAFFEFVEADEARACAGDWSKARVRLADELTDGLYEVFITSPGGPYRRRVGDVVRVEGAQGACPRVVLERRRDEPGAVPAAAIIAACERAAADVGVIADNMAAEADASATRYVVRVEFATRDDARAGRRFLAALDRRLREGTPAYAALRDADVLAPPVLHVMREGWGERRRAREGVGADGAHVIDRLAADLEAVVQI